MIEGKRFLKRSTLATKVAGLLFLFGLASSIYGQSFTIEQVMGAPFPSELTTSMHGGRIAWVFDDKGARNVWTAEAPDFVPHQVTRYQGDDGQQIASLRLTPDGKTAVYARGTEVNSSGRAANPLSEPKQPTQQVWAAEVTGGEPRLLGEMGCGEEGCEDIQVSPDGKYAVWPGRHELWIAPIAESGKGAMLSDMRGDVSSPVWSADGSRLAFVVVRGDHSLVVIAKVDDGKLANIRYVAPSVDRDEQPRWSPDGSHLAFLRLEASMNKEPIIPMRTIRWSVWVADAGTLDGREAWKSGAGARDSFPIFGDTSFAYAASNRIIFNSEQDGWSHLYSMDATQGGVPVLLTPGNFDVEDVSLSADKGSILFSSNQDDTDRRHLWRVDAGGGKPPVALTRGETIEWTPMETGNGSTVVCLGSTATSPALVYSVSDGQRKLLTKDATPSDFPAKLLVMPKQVIFQSADGYRIHGQLFEPNGQNKAKPGPALIFVHGGPMRQMMLGFHYMDYYNHAYAENQYLANRGFTVLSVNYRLGIMYGHDFREAPNASWRGSSEYGDVLAGAKYLMSLPNVDPHRIGIWGGSYGGLLTALGLARNSDIFAAGVDYHGVHDWSMFLPQWQEGAPSAPDYQEALKLAWQSSPDSSVDRWKSPVLLIQGDDDRNVPFNQMVDLVQRLRARQVPFEQIVYPDEIHGFLLYRHWIQSYQATADFFERQLGSSHP